jgi:C_GCAxxG_C_C family probable redox protein
MLEWEKKHSPRTEALVAQIRDHARNLFETRRLLCAEAVVAALNQGLDGGLSESQAVALAAPFCDAMGHSGCMCGALSGAVMGSGLLLGKDHPHRHRKEIRDSARQMHDAFKRANGSTCCRVLSKDVSLDKKTHIKQCADLTAQAAELATRLILQKRPELLIRDNDEFLARRESIIGGALFRLFHLLSH